MRSQPWGERWSQGEQPKAPRVGGCHAQGSEGKQGGFGAVNRSEGPESNGTR